MEAKLPERVCSHRLGHWGFVLLGCSARWGEGFNGALLCKGCPLQVEHIKVGMVHFVPQEGCMQWHRELGL